MADGTEANTTINMETEPSKEEMDNETYDEILATFVLAKMRSDGGKATTVTSTPIPVWAATVATQTRRGRHKIRRRDLEILGGNNLHFGEKVSATIFCHLICHIGRGGNRHNKITAPAPTTRYLIIKVKCPIVRR